MPPGDRPVRARRRAGFTMLEMTTALVLAAVMLSIAGSVFSKYQERVSARRAAEIFARDLTMARAMAVRSREVVTVRFNESGLIYTVTTASGRQLANRRYNSAAGDVRLSAMDLALSGDTLAFSSRGIGSMTGSALGSATFRAGKITYRVQFNTMGAAKMAPL